MLKVEGSEWGRKSSRYCWASRSLEIGDDKEKAEEQIRTGKDQVRPVHLSLRDEGNPRRAVSGFFEDGRNHERPITRGVCGDEDKATCHARATPTNPCPQRKTQSSQISSPPPAACELSQNNPLAAWVKANSG